MYPARLKIIFWITLAAFMIMTGRLAYLQVFTGGKYSGISKKRLVKDSTIPARRGNIYDRHGRPLAVEEASFDILVQYKYLLYSYLRSTGEMPPALYQIKEHKNIDRQCEECHPQEDLWVEALSALLDASPDQLLEKAEKIVNWVEGMKARVQKRQRRPIRIQEEFSPHPIARDVPIEKVAIIETNQPLYPGVSLDPRPKRYYPGHELASHLLGHLGRLNERELEEVKSLQEARIRDERLSLYYNSLTKDSLVGKSGIEAYYNLELSGSPGKRVEEIVLKTLKVDKIIFNIPPRHGDNVFLTVDLDIQKVAEEALGQRKGSVIVMNPYTGEVMAMVSSPRFNPNTFNKDPERLQNDPGRPFINRPIQTLSPPGSTFKLITALAGLEEGGIEPGTQFLCRGELKVRDRRLRCTSLHGLTGLDRAIEHSCNIYFFELAKRLDGQLLQGWAEKFGLAEKTGIDLPYEKSGNMPLPVSLGQRLNVSIGQGDLLVTPLQMTRVIAAIANGGILVRPFLLKKITNADGAILQEARPEGEKEIGIPPRYLLALQGALRRVVVGGTAKGMGLEELGVAGKTGTAQTPAKDLNHAWFIGYFPHDNPRYCFSVMVEDTPGHGGEVAGPIARELVAGILHKTQMQLGAKLLRSRSPDPP